MSEERRKIAEKIFIEYATVNYSTMNRLVVFLFAVAFLATPPAYAHQWCNGADGIYAEDWIQRLQGLGKTSNEKDKVTLERIVANLRVWLRANEHIGETAGFLNRLFVCDLPGPNAYVTTKNEPVRVHASTVWILGTDENVIATVLGHEYSHLSLNHAAERIATHKALIDWAGQAYGNIMQRTWNSQEASREAVSLYKGEMSAFTRQQEEAADDEGIKLMSKAGYKPTAFFSLAYILMAYSGDSSKEAFPSHPGWVERMVKGEDRVNDENYNQTAKGFSGNNDFKAISNLVKEWITLLPDSANAWYYKATLLRQLKDPQALETLEEAFLGTRKPSINQSQGDIKEAWVWLCAQLYREGYTVESAWCGKILRKKDEESWAKFQRQTFQGMIWVGGGDGGNGGGRELNMIFIKKPDGTKLITNNISIANDYGVETQQVTPAWRPVRYKSCASTTQKPCPIPRDKTEQKQPAAVRDREDDPFREARANCKPPTCRVVQ